jgi:hypothetical protein
MEGLEALKAGAFNNMSVWPQDDGSQVIALYHRESRQTWTFRVRDLYGPGEQLLNVETGEPLL